MISQLEKDLRIERRRLLNEAIKKFGIKTSALSLLTGISDGNISNYKTGASEITEENWGKLQKGIETISNEQPPLPNIEVEKWEYVAQQLKNQGNVVINKNKIKNIAQYMIDLKLNGFDCSYEVANDGYIISLSKNSKPMVEKVIQSKKVVEPTVDVVAKARKMHEDALVLHEEALKLQASTEEIVKSVDEMEAKFTLATQEDVDKIVPGMREGIPAFNEMLNELFPDDKYEQITITEQDILEAVEHNQKMMHSLPPEEEAELKELADEQLIKCGLSKESKEDSFINFLKDRFTHEEIKGFIRGITILSVLDEDYQKASYFIDYFINNGYAPEEMRL